MLTGGAISSAPEACGARRREDARRLNVSKSWDSGEGHKHRETSARWQYAAELLLDGADVADFSKQVELALFFDAKLDVTAMA